MANTYTAVVLDPPSRELLLGSPIPEGWKTFGEHMTIDLKPLSKSVGFEIGGQTKRLTIVAVGLSEAALAVEVMTDVPSKNARKHVTIAVAPGCRPMQSNEIEQWDTNHLLVGSVLEGVVMEVTK